MWCLCKPNSFPPASSLAHDAEDEQELSALSLLVYIFGALMVLVLWPPSPSRTICSEVRVGLGHSL